MDEDVVLLPSAHGQTTGDLGLPLIQWDVVPSQNFLGGNAPFPSALDAGLFVLIVRLLEERPQVSDPVLMVHKHVALCMSHEAIPPMWRATTMRK